MTGPDLLPDDVFIQNPEIVERQIGQSMFLAEASGEAIFQLNETGGALWRLLAEPTGLDKAVEVFCQAFPDRDRDELVAELSALMTALHRRELILSRE